LLTKLATEPRVWSSMGSHRIRPTLQDMLQAFGDRVVALAKLTKAHGQLVVRPISIHLTGPLEERGEFTLVVQGLVPALLHLRLPKRIVCG
jgi:16S rRNA C1402 (ribose-2'-O) methylase RsmI